MTADLRREAILAALLVVGLTGVAFADPWRQGEPQGPAAPRQVQPTPASERNEPGPALGGSVGGLRPGVTETMRPGTAGGPRSRGTARWRRSVSPSSSGSDSSA
jgi:hypothetical protein